jgi:hypothetical protein
VKGISLIILYIFRSLFFKRNEETKSSAAALVFVFILVTTLFVSELTLYFLGNNYFVNLVRGKFPLVLLGPLFSIPFIVYVNWSENKKNSFRNMRRIIKPYQNIAKPIAIFLTIFILVELFGIIFLLVNQS